MHSGCDKQLTVFCQGPQFSRVSQAAHDLEFNPARRQAEQPLEQQLTLLEREAFRIAVEWQQFQPLKGGTDTGISAGSTSLREAA